MYEGNGQATKAIELLERVVAMKADVFAEEHPTRLRSERMLAGFDEDLSSEFETDWSSVSSTQDYTPVEEDQDPRIRKDYATVLSLRRQTRCQ